jgi:predicted DNA-binding protein
MSNVTHSPQQRLAVKIRLHPDTYERVGYWSDKAGLSANEYMSLAVEEKIARANGDYDLPALEIQRLNQMVDELKALSANVTNIETVVVTGFDSLLGLTRGDSYLQDEDDGELDTDSAFGEVDADALGAGFGGAV